MRGFIWKIQLSIEDGKFKTVPILDGSHDNRSLSSDTCLVSYRVLSMFGKFLAFSIRNADVCFYGLNSLLVKMLYSKEFQLPNYMQITDIPDLKVRAALEIVSLKLCCSMGAKLYPELPVVFCFSLKDSEIAMSSVSRQVKWPQSFHALTLFIGVIPLIPES